jgi:hypothetical protein
MRLSSRRRPVRQRRPILTACQRQSLYEVVVKEDYAQFEYGETNDGGSEQVGSLNEFQHLMEHECRFVNEALFDHILGASHGRNCTASM